MSLREAETGRLIARSIGIEKIPDESILEDKSYSVLVVLTLWPSAALNLLTEISVK